MLSPVARKRLEWHRRDLHALQEVCRTVPVPEIEAAYQRYLLRLGRIQAGWRAEMSRRAGLLLESDKSSAPRVWEMVENIRAVLWRPLRWTWPPKSPCPCSKRRYSGRKKPLAAFSRR